MLDPDANPESLDAISERLRITREALSGSQSEWCQRVGIARNAWNNYERGIRRISIDEAFKVARYANVTLDWIYRGRRKDLPSEVIDHINKAA